MTTKLFVLLGENSYYLLDEKPYRAAPSPASPDSPGPDRSGVRHARPSTTQGRACRPLACHSPRLGLAQPPAVPAPGKGPGTGVWGPWVFLFI